MGLPLGAGLSTYFLAYEQGIPFLIRAIPWGILGLSSSLLFSLSYYLTDRWFPHPLRIIAALRSSLVAILVYGVVSLCLRALPLRIEVALLLTFGTIFLNLGLVRWLIPPSIKPPKTKFNLKLVLLRGLITAFTIASITGLARIIGPVWSGILSAFPIILFQVLVFLHVEEGPNVYPGIITGFAYSVMNLLLFYLLLAFLLPVLGLNLTYLIVYLFSMVFLYLLNRLRH
ncbi:MAG: hypothetical protein N2442_00075 [Spirochaetes bacterium]|nr:hypothetical protein [Spirochaetota bacterium]